MSRRRPKRDLHGHELHRGRGRHKKASSPETRAWEAEHLIPERPPWLPAETYVKLADLRRKL